MWLLWQALAGLRLLEVLVYFMYIIYLLLNMYIIYRMIVVVGMTYHEHHLSSYYPYILKLRDISNSIPTPWFGSTGIVMLTYFLSGSNSLYLYIWDIYYIYLILLLPSYIILSRLLLQHIYVTRFLAFCGCLCLIVCFLKRNMWPNHSV